MKLKELKKIIQEAVRTEVRNVLREELKSLSLNQTITEEVTAPKVKEFKEHKLTRTPREVQTNFGVKNPILNDILAETAATGDFSTMNVDSSMAQNFTSPTTPGTQTDFNNQPVQVSEELSNVFTRDYSALMKHMDK